VDLPRLWTVLADRLDATGRRSWYEQERDAVRTMPPIEERRSWTRLRGIGRLDRRAQTRARALWQTREALARNSDTAPNRILPDRTLLDLAAKPVTDARGLRLRGMRRQYARLFGAELLEALNDEQATPVAPRSRRFDEHDRLTVDRLRAQRSRIAEREQLDPGVLCPNRALERAVALRPATMAELREALDLRPWQWDLMAVAFMEALDLAAPGTPTLPGRPAAAAPAPAKDQTMADVLNPDALHHEVDRLDGWEGTTKEGISKRYTFDDFAGSIAFVNQLAEHAERVGHHPDLAISWNTVIVTYVTHSAGGVTQADIEQARAIDGLPR
jgi:pterin-4a-carbinolamine dehydratase